MNTPARADHTLNLIDELRSDLAELVTAARRSGDTNAGFERLHRWKDRAARKVGEVVSADEGRKLTAKRKMSFRMGDPVGNLVDEAQMYDGFLSALAQEISEHPEDVLDRPLPDEADALDPVAVPAPKGRAVFLVHGHDELNLLRMKELLRDRYGLEPIVLSNEAGKGRSIIEKFEDEAQRAAFAFVLLTPDDVISKSDTEYSQARPNVIFELGWFYGRLGRDRVCILFKRGTKIHSDLDGVSRVEFSDSVVEKVTEIEKELVAGQMLTKQ